MTNKKKIQNSIKTKPETRSTELVEKSDEEKIRKIIKCAMYQMADQFISEKVAPEIENQSIKNAKDRTLEEIEIIIEKEATSSINELKLKGVSKVKDVNEQPQVVIDVLNKIQIRMEKNAKELSKK